MNGARDKEREVKALDALIVGALRPERDSEEVNADAFPELTEREKQALDSLGPDFGERLVNGELSESSTTTDSVSEDAEELVVSAEEFAYGMNRAEQIAPETAEELDAKRREILKRKIEEKKRQQGGERG